jgi:predicted nucleic acid binding AN1-type Zn finger protein
MWDSCSFCKKKKMCIECICGEKMCLAHRFREFHNCPQLQERDEKEKQKMLDQKLKSAKIVFI